MAYGMEVKDSAGAIIFDSSTVTWIQVGFFTVTSGDTTTRVFPGAEQFSEIKTQQWFINTPPDNQEAFSHVLSIATNANNVTVTPSVGNQTQGVLVLGR